jgi:hypothetical protein
MSDTDVDYKLQGIRPFHLIQGVKRWHTLELSAPQSLADHHWAVTMLLKMICPDALPVMTDWAMVHDMDELVSGDIPGHFKAGMDEKVLAGLNEEIHKRMPEWWRKLYWRAHLPNHGPYLLALKACDVADQARVARRIVGASMRSSVSTSLDIRLGVAIDILRDCLAEKPIPMHPNWISILSSYRTEA